MVNLVQATPRNKKGTLSFTIPKKIVSDLGLKKGDQFFVVGQKGKVDKIIFERAPQ